MSDDTELTITQCSATTWATAPDFTLTTSQLPSHTHSHNIYSPSLSLNEPTLQDMNLAVSDSHGNSYRISLLDLAKKLNMEPETNAKPKKCYE